MINLKLLLLLITTMMLSFQLLHFDPAWGQSKAQVSSSDTKNDDTTETPTITTLKSLIRSMQDLESRLKVLKPELKAAETEEQKIKITAEINRLAKSLDEPEKDFERISIGVDLDTFGEKQEQDFDWKNEAQELPGPALQEIKSMTERPRQLERLRSEVAHYENKVPIVKKSHREFTNTYRQDKR